MIFLVLTTEGLKEALAFSSQNNCAIWCTSSAITKNEFNTMKNQNLTRFSYSFTVFESEVLSGALETIREHHPGEHIWIEGR